MIHAELQERGAVSGEEHRVKVLTPRQDMTGVDRAWAAQYEPGDVVRYSKGSRRWASAPANMPRSKAPTASAICSPSNARTASG